MKILIAHQYNEEISHSNLEAILLAAKKIKIIVKVVQMIVLTLMNQHLFYYQMGITM